VNFVAFSVLSGLIEQMGRVFLYKKQGAMTLRILISCKWKKLRTERKFSQLQQVTLSA